jgi:hypothetical protein
VITRWILLVLGGAAAIVALDAAMARTARALSINYGYFFPLSFAAYLGFGALAVGYTSIALATAAAVPVALADVTLGWQIAIRTGVVPEAALRRSLAMKVGLGLLIILEMTFLAYLGALLPAAID